MNAMTGLGRIVGPLAGTFIFARWGGHATYVGASAIIVLALLLAFTLPRKELT
jgi:predicted MFS family arabinose efflux permease